MVKDLDKDRTYVGSLALHEVSREQNWFKPQPPPLQYFSFNRSKAVLLLQFFVRALVVAVCCSSPFFLCLGCFVIVAFPGRFSVIFV